MGGFSVTDDGWQVDPRPAPPELAEDFEAERFAGSEPLRTDTDEWLALVHRLSDKDRAALSKVVNIANAILDNDLE